MSAYKITLQSNLDHGTFYWVSTVNAASEEEAVTAVEHLFLEQIDNVGEWNFCDYMVEKL